MFKHRLLAIFILRENNISAPPVRFQPTSVKLQHAACKGRGQKKTGPPVEHHTAVTMSWPAVSPRSVEEVLESMCLRDFAELPHQVYIVPLICIRIRRDEAKRSWETLIRCKVTKHRAHVRDRLKVKLRLYNRPRDALEGGRYGGKLDLFVRNS